MPTFSLALDPAIAATTPIMAVETSIPFLRPKNVRHIMAKMPSIVRRQDRISLIPFNGCFCGLGRWEWDITACGVCGVMAF